MGNKLTRVSKVKRLPENSNDSVDRMDNAIATDNFTKNEESEKPLEPERPMPCPGQSICQSIKIKPLDSEEELCAADTQEDLFQDTSEADVSAVTISVNDEDNTATYQEADVYSTIPYAFSREDETRSSKATTTSGDSGAGSTITCPSDENNVDEDYLHFPDPGHHRLTPLPSKKHRQRKLCDDLLRAKKRIDDENRLEQMTMVYMENIEKMLEVKDVLPHLRHVIGDEAYEEIHSKLDNTSKIELVRLLFQKLRNSDTKGKWQAFVNALTESEYVSIVNMLLNQSERDSVELRALLYLITPYIADKLHAKTCTDRFFEQDIITVSDKDEIECIQQRSGEIAAMRVLLDKVPRKSPKWDTALADVLRENGLNDIANLFSLHGDNNAQPCAKPADVSAPLAQAPFDEPDVCSNPAQETARPQSLPVPIVQTTAIFNCNACETNPEQLKFMTDKIETMERELKEIKKLVMETNSGLLKLIAPPPCAITNAYDSGCADMDLNLFSEACEFYV